MKMKIYDEITREEILVPDHSAGQDLILEDHGNRKEPKK